MATTAGVHGPHTNPQTRPSRTLGFKFCCAVGPTDTQRPSIEADSGEVCALAGAAGRGRALNSKFSTTRFNDTVAGAPLAPASGRTDSVIWLRTIAASTRSRRDPS